MKSLIIFCLWFCFSYTACNPQTNKTPINKKAVLASVADSTPKNKNPEPVSTPKKPDFTLPYQLDQPAKTFKLPPALNEISGLSCGEMGKSLCAVQDEKGRIYPIDPNDGTVGEPVKFWKSGDYEGIEHVGNTIYVIKSTGTLYEVNNIGEEEQDVIKYNTFLTRENDVEGLGYDKDKNCLLIACKGLPTGEDSYDVAKMKKEVYRFDLKTKTLSSEPAFVITQQMLYDFLMKYDMGSKSDKMLNYFQPNRSLLFSPSALGVHPISKDIYILSSVKKILIVLGQSGEVKHITLLNKRLHRQPEGLTFNEEGVLFISNEGKEGIAKIHRFDYLQ